MRESGTDVKDYDDMPDEVEMLPGEVSRISTMKAAADTTGFRTTAFNEDGKMVNSVWGQTPIASILNMVDSIREAMDPDSPLSLALKIIAQQAE